MSESDLRRLCVELERRTHCRVLLALYQERDDKATLSVVTSDVLRRKGIVEHLLAWFA